MIIRPGIKKTIDRLELIEAAVGYEDGQTILKEQNLELKIGDSYWVTGTAGCGKSTLLRMLAGLLMPTKGQYYVNHDLASEMSFEEFMPYRLNIGYSFDLGGLMNNRTLFDNLMLPLLYHKACHYTVAEKRVNELLEIFHVERYRNERPASVPGAVRKASCVARAFVMEPEVLLLDEPTTGLTEEALHALSLCLENWKKTGQRKPLLLMTSRQKAFAEKWCEKTLRITDTTILSEAV